MAKLDPLYPEKWTFGTHLHYNSFMENVDQLFESGAFDVEVLDIFTLADANIFDMGIKKSRERLNLEISLLISDCLISLQKSYLLNFGWKCI